MFKTYDCEGRTLRVEITGTTTKQEEDVAEVYSQSLRTMLVCPGSVTMAWGLLTGMLETLKAMLKSGA